jgi:hypothetical protein
MSDSEPLLIYPIPSLISILVNREEEKGSALTEEEVVEIRNGCKDVAAKIDAERGYKDIDPVRCWEEWLEVRKSF